LKIFSDNDGRTIVSNKNEGHNKKLVLLFFTNKDNTGIKEDTQQTSLQLQRLKTMRKILGKSIFKNKEVLAPCRSS